MSNVIHYGVDYGSGSGTHKGLRENCTAPDCAWPSEGDRATGVNAGVEWTGEIVDLDGFLPVIQTPDGAQRTVTDLRKPDKGVYCRHGVKVMAAVPAEHICQPPRPLCTLGREDPFHQCPEPEPCKACYPDLRIVEPWPCGVGDCTQERFEKALQEDADEYWAGVSDLIASQYD